VPAVPDLKSGKLEQMSAENGRINDALALATRDALLEHARMGRSVPVSRDGQIVMVSPEEIFAQYGLDEHGKPKA
jgi:hypothetical protein